MVLILYIILVGVFATGFYLGTNIKKNKIMEKKINVAEILKDCPEGMELDCTKYSNVYFVGIDDYKKEPKIKLKIETLGTWCSELTLDKYGKESSHPNAKCLIFPKGKTTWEGFVPSWKFKEEDIVYVVSTSGIRFIIIFKEINNNYLHKYACYDFKQLYIDKHPVCHILDVETVRPATEEEKAKLFQAIKDNGYKWNAETKTLEKLLRFKVGDRIKKKGDYISGIITQIDIENFYKVEYCNGGVSYINSEYQDKYELVPVKPKFKVDDKIKLKGGDEFGIITQVSDCFYTIKCKNNTHYWSIKKQDDWELINEPKFKVGNRIKNKSNYIATIIKFKDDYYYYKDEYGYGMFHISGQDQWELVSDKFDINTLVPFESRVLVRDRNTEKWKSNFWGFYDIDSAMNYPYECCGSSFGQCIPYEGNEHLLGTSNDCADFYKTWK